MDSAPVAGAGVLYSSLCLCLSLHSAVSIYIRHRIPLLCGRSRNYLKSPAPAILTTLMHLSEVGVKPTDLKSFPIAPRYKYKVVGVPVCEKAAYFFSLTFTLHIYYTMIFRNFQISNDIPLK